MQYELIGYRDWTEALKWGFLAEHVTAVRWEATPHPAYTELLKLVGEKGHFVLTTNVEGMFAKSGFTEERIYTPQGSYARYQCLQPCTTDTWPLKPVVDRIRPSIDASTQEITDPELVPLCPHGGGPVFMNVRGGNWFIDAPYREQEDRFYAWLEKTTAGALVIVEIGSGFNTPGVIRWPMEAITRQHQSARLIRVNVDHPEVPAALSTRAISIRGRAIEWVRALRRPAGCPSHTGARDE